jgi:hypothetical protein
MRIEMELRNMPLFRLIEYLTEAGGTPISDRAVVADTWHADVLAMEPAVITAILKVPRDMLVIEGEDTDVQRVGDFMRRQTMRGGG